MRRVSLFARDSRDPKFKIRNVKFEVPKTSNFESRPSSLLANSFHISHSEFGNPELSTSLPVAHTVLVSLTIYERHRVLLKHRLFSDSPPDCIQQRL